MTTLLKFVHIGAIGIWSAGLIVLPYLFWQRGHLPGGGFELDRLQRLTRFIYVALTSPAAFLAIASGTALIFLQATFAEWFSLKLLLVGAMAMLHVVAGLIGTRLILTDARFGAPSFLGLTGHRRLGMRSNTLSIPRPLKRRSSPSCCHVAVSPGFHQLR